MTHINLLPWREARRKEREREFAVMTGGAAVLVGVIVFYAHIQINGMIESQGARNSFLAQETAALDKEIGEIRSLEAEKSRLLARMNVIQDLQLSRPEIVHLFGELATTLPEGVYYTAIKQQGAGLIVGGIAQSNARVSTLMRNLENSPWLEKPVLDVIETTEKDKARTTRFMLRASQKQSGSGKSAVETADKDKKAGAKP